MEDRYRGLTASLSLVTMAALVVAFGSSARRHDTQEELLHLQRQIQNLSQENRTLEEKLRWAEGRTAQFLSLGRRLNEALLEERARAQELAERLQREEVRRSPTLPEAGSSESPSAEASS